MKKLLLLTAVLLSVSASTKGINVMRDGSQAQVKISSGADNQVMLAYIDSFQIYAPQRVETKNDLLNNVDSAYSTSSDSTTEQYAKGQTDARKYHKRVIGNAALGFLFGPIGCLGAAIGNPKAPDVLYIKDDSLLRNQDYRAGYKKKAKSQNLGNAAIGWGTWLALYFVMAVATGSPLR